MGWPSNASAGDSTNESLLGDDPTGRWWRTAPDNNDLWDQLRWAWPLHKYGLACMFSLLCCATFFTILGLRAQLSSRPHLSSLNAFLCLLAASRALGLFLDPYGTRKLLPPVMLALLWDLAFPCLLSAFSLLQLSLLRGVQGVAPPKLSSETCLTLVITCHFCLVLAANILWTVQSSLRVLWLATQMIFASWGLFLCACFLFGCSRALRDMAKSTASKSCSFEDNGVFLGLHVGTLPPVGLPVAVPVPGSEEEPCTPNCTTISSSLATTAGSQEQHPKIRITDENDQTHSYASETPQHQVTGSAPGSPVLGGGRANRRAHLEDRQWAKRKDSQDPSQCCPLMGPEEMSTVGPPILPSSDSLVQETLENHQNAILMALPTATGVSTGEMLGSKILSKMANRKLVLLRSSAPLNDFQFESSKLRPGCRSGDGNGGLSQRLYLEKLLRRLLITSCMGALLCLFQVYGVLGPHGLSATRENRPAVVPWFAYQTVYRILEFSMGCAMGRLTRLSLRSCGLHHSHGHSYKDSLKYRESLFS